MVGLGIDQLKLNLGPEYSSSVLEEEVIGEQLDVAWGVLKIVCSRDRSSANSSVVGNRSGRYRSEIASITYPMPTIPTPCMRRDRLGGRPQASGKTIRTAAQYDFTMLNI